MFMMNDQRLLGQLREGDKEVFRFIFETYYSPLVEFASQYIADADAEELVQDFMFFIWESREYIVIESSLKSYLFVSVRNRCLNAIRKHQYNQKIHALLYEKLKEQFESPDNYLLNELSENIQKAIQELPETYRETFILSRFGALTNNKIAAQLGVSVKTVEYRITRSLKVLRIKLKDYLPLLTGIINL